MVISVKTYEQVALEDGDETWELAHGVLRKKPGVTAEHSGVMSALARQLYLRLDENQYDLRVNSTRLRIPSGSFYVPDLVVVPRTLVLRARGRPDQLEVYAEPMPLVVEVWSRSTGDYDVEVKLQEYQARQDNEIWRLHPYQRTLTAWRLQPDGTYDRREYPGGTVRPIALPDVEVDVVALFA
jgi:Uma2 family endonuclease